MIVDQTIRDMPQLQPYWAAGFSFSRGHFKLRVPYDAYQPMVFQVSKVQYSAVQSSAVQCMCLRMHVRSLHNLI